MPIVDVQWVADDPPPTSLAQKVADVAGAVFGTAPQRTWVRVHHLACAYYAENKAQVSSDPVATPAPVFVTVLKAEPPCGAELADEVAELTQRLAQVCQRDAEHIHILYEPGAAGRIAFGGRLVPPPPHPVDDETTPKK